MLDQSVIAQKLAIDGGPKAVTNKLVGWPQVRREGDPGRGATCCAPAR